MSDLSTASLSPAPGSTAAAPSVLEILEKTWGWFLVLGIILIVVGTLAIGASFIASLAVVMVFGTLLLVGGSVQVIGAFFSRRWRGFFQELLAGILYLVVGLLMVNHPLAALATFTLLLAAFFLVAGIARIVVAVTERFENWGWVLLSGLVTLTLGVLIWQGWPVSALWVIGLFVGIEMIFCGWSWVTLALTARAVAKNAA